MLHHNSRQTNGHQRTTSSGSSNSLSGSGTSIMVPVLPSSFYAYIKRNIPASSLRARDWGEFTESALVKVVEGLSPSCGPPALLQIYERDVRTNETSKLMWTCPISPQNLREVQDSSRYFSLKIASDINSGEEICLGIAFYTKDDSTAFVAKLWSVIQKVNAVKELRNEEEMQKKYGDMKLTDDDDEDESLWLSMSDELAIEVFKKLSYRDLCNVACTCVKWNLIANDDLLWKELYRKERYPPMGGSDKMRLTGTRARQSLFFSWKTNFVNEWKRAHPVGKGDEQVEIKSQWLDGDLSIKLVAVGDDCNRLKTKLLFTYTDRYPEDYVPTVFENHVVTRKIGDFTVDLNLWDTAGSGEYDRLRPLYYGETDVFIVLYSVINRTSFQNVAAKWVPEITRFCPGVPIILVAGDVHLRSDASALQKLAAKGESLVTEEEGEELASVLRERGFPCRQSVECSALKNWHVKKVFDCAVRAVILEKRAKRKRTKRKREKSCLLS